MNKHPTSFSFCHDILSANSGVQGSLLINTSGVWLYWGTKKQLSQNVIILSLAFIIILRQKHSKKIKQINILYEYGCKNSYPICKSNLVLSKNNKTSWQSKLYPENTSLVQHS